MQLNKEKIHYYQKNRGEFLMIDYVQNLKIGESAVGYKELDKDLWFLKSIGLVILICLHHYN